MMHESSWLGPSDDGGPHEIEALLDEVAQFARRDVSAQEFHAVLLDRAIKGLAAIGGAVWRRVGDEPIMLVAQEHLDQARLNENRAAAQRHGELLATVLRSREPRLIPPNSGDGNAGGSLNSTGLLLVLAPFDAGHAAAGVLELLQRPGTAAGAQRGYLRFVSALAEIASDFHGGQELKRLYDREALFGQFETFVERIHESLELQPTAYAIANEGRRLIGCDRVSVLVGSARRPKVEAASGVDQIDSRSPAVRGLARLSSAVLISGEPFFFSDNVEALAPQLQAPLQAYVDQSHARTIVVMPLREHRSDRESREPGPIIGALVAENFDTRALREAIEPRGGAVARQAAIAITSALAHRNVPLMPVWRVVNRIGWLTKARQLPKTLLALIVLAGVIAALVLVQTDFEIEARGELQPIDRRDVFARTDGIVSELKVSDAEEVAADQVLAVLRKPQLDLDSSRIIGELQTTRKRLAAVQASRLAASNPRSGDTPEKYNQLTAEEEELKVLLTSLENQEQVLKLQRADLEVRSPIAGVVVTWNVKQQLEARPVDRGQALLTVADLAGPWQLELQVPDHHAGYLLEARRDIRPDLDVSFILATDPGVTYAGRLSEMALATEPQEDEGPTVLVKAGIDREQVSPLRPGATVVAKIHCGRRSLGFVWLHDVWAAIRSRVLF